MFVIYFAVEEMKITKWWEKLIVWLMSQPFQIDFIHSRNTLLMTSKIVNSNYLKIEIEVSNMSSLFAYDEDVINVISYSWFLRD